MCFNGKMYKVQNNVCICFISLIYQHILLQDVSLFLDVHCMLTLKGRALKSLCRGHVPYQGGGGDPPPAKK